MIHLLEPIIKVLTKIMENPLIIPTISTAIVIWAITTIRQIINV